MIDPTTPPSTALDAVDSLLARVLEHPAGEREAALQELCAKHPEWERELRDRLRLLQDMGFLEEEAGRKQQFPERLGDFRLLEMLGGGGMGVVYRAVQESLGREVALKLVRPDHMFFPGALAWFRREIEAVAALQHPGIVSVHTVGEAEGVPYFAMELVDGESLSAIVRRLRRRPQERLTAADFGPATSPPASAVEDDAPPVRRGVLAMRSWADACVATVLHVAQALEHAHSRGVIHRDIKPSNVMLTSDGRAQVLDFGLAAREGSAKLTRTGTAMGSLAYMSPEQVRGETVDARTDVYSLGVTLYELLTLQEPFFDESSEALKAQILRGQPKPLRVLNRRVPWDVETVCLRAMAPERAQRYRSMADFAADLRRLLAREPIAARRPGAWLRLRRFVQRHPTASVGAALGAALAFGLPTGLLLQQRAANREITSERDRAEEQAEAARRVTRFFVDSVHLADPERAFGSAVTVRQMLDDAAARVESELAGQPQARAALQVAMGSAYRSLGLYAQSRPLLTAAVALAEAEHLDLLADARLELARQLRSEGDLAGARLELDSIAAADGSDAAGAERAVLVQVERAYVQHQEGDRSGALATLAKAATDADAIGPDSEAKLTVWRTRIELLLAHEGYREAAELMPEVRALAERRHGVEHPVHADLLHASGRIERALGRPEQALAAYRDALAACAKTWGEDTLHGVSTRESMAFALADLGRGEEGLAELRRAADLRRRLLGDDHASIGTNLGLQGELALGEGDVELAEQCLSQAEVRLQASHAGNEHVLANLATQRMTAALLAGDVAAAREHAERARALYAGLEAESEARAAFLERYGILLLQAGEAERGLGVIDECLQVRVAVHGADHARIAHTRQVRGQALLASGRAADALAEADAGLAAVAGQGRAEGAEAALLHSVRAQALDGLDRIDEAVDAGRRAIELFRAAVGDDHPSMVALLTNHALALVKKGDPSARDALRQALARGEKTWPAAHPQLARLRRHLAVVLHADGDRAGAAEQARLALPVLEAVYGPDSPDVSLMRSYLAEPARRR